MNSLFNLILTVLVFQVACKWTKIETTGNKPLNRGAGEMREVDGTLVLFGGFTDCFNETTCPNGENVFYNDIYHFDTETNIWQKPVTYPDGYNGFPAPRALFGATVYDDALVIYGGSSFPVNYFTQEQWEAGTENYGDLWLYRPSSFTWERIFPRSYANPGARTGTALVSKGNRLILSGGVNPESFLAVEDTWEFNFNTKIWVQKTGQFSFNIPNPFGGAIDLGRFSFPFARVGNKAYAYSGEVLPIPPVNVLQHQDLWEYSINSATWKEVTPFSENTCGTPNGHTGRVYGGMVAVGNILVAFFGDNNDRDNECGVDAAAVFQGQSPSNETWVLKLKPKSKREWKLMNSEIQSPRLKRVYFANSEEECAVYVWGGFDVDCDVTEATDLVWNNEMYKLHWSDVFDV